MFRRRVAGSLAVQQPICRNAEVSVFIGVVAQAREPQAA